MSKFTVWSYFKATDIIERYQDEDEGVTMANVVESLPKAKEKAIDFLKTLIKEVENLKLKDLQ